MASQGQDKRTNIDSVCAEFGDLASGRERDFLFDELLPNEVVSVVLKGEVPFDPKQPAAKRGTGIAVATNRRALFLGHDATGDRSGMLLPKAGIAHASSNEESFSSSIRIISSEGVVYEGVDLLPKHGAVRLIEALRTPDPGLEGTTGRSEIDQSVKDAMGEELSKLRSLMSSGVISASDFARLRKSYESLTAVLTDDEFPYSASDLLTDFKVSLDNGAMSREEFNDWKAAVVELCDLTSKLAWGQIDETQYESRTAALFAGVESKHEASHKQGDGEYPDSDTDLAVAASRESEQADEELGQGGNKKGTTVKRRPRTWGFLDYIIAFVTIIVLAVVAVVVFYTLGQSSEESGQGSNATSGASVAPTTRSRATPQPTRASALAPTPDNRVFCSDEAYEVALAELQAFDMSPDSNVRGSQLAPVILRMVYALDCASSQHRSRYTLEKQCRSSALHQAWIAMERIGNQSLRSAALEDRMFASQALDATGQIYTDCLLYG